MLTLPPFFFFFQLLHNWPRMAMILWNTTISSDLNDLSIVVTRPRFATDRLVNTETRLRDEFARVDASVCDTFNSTQLFYRWQLSWRGKVEKDTVSRRCNVTFHPAKQSEYTISVSIHDDIGEIVSAGRKSLLVKDIWIAVVGDSYASGEGNPSSRPSLTWLSDEEWCHRSEHSMGFVAAERIAALHPPTTAVHLTLLACTGATIEHGLLRTQHGGQPRSQIDTLRDMAGVRGYGPDVVVMTIGGNDVGYGEILSALQQGAVSKHAEMRLFYVSHQLDRLAEAIRAVNPARLLLPLYYDFSQGDNGEVDTSCMAMTGMSSSCVEEARRRVLHPLNALLAKTAVRHEWTPIPVSHVFDNKGLCSSESLIRSRVESERLQHSWAGAFHPNQKAHQQIADMIAQRIL